MTKGPDSEEVDAQRVDRVDDLPAIESEVETSPTVSTSEVDSEWGDRMETLLVDESDSEVETGPTTAPTRRSAQIAAKPVVSYKESVDDPMLEILERKGRRPNRGAVGADVGPFSQGELHRGGHGSHRPRPLIGQVPNPIRAGNSTHGQCSEQ